MVKYNIYIICKDEDEYIEKKQEIEKKYKNKVCYFEWVPAVYLTLSQCNKKILKSLNTRYNTSQKKIIAKLGNIAAHRNALLSIYMNKTDNNIILESDATLDSTLPVPPAHSCYMGGWITPPQISKAGKVKIDVKPKKGLNVINYQKYNVLMTHALFIKSFEEAIELFQTTIVDQIKNYDIHLAKLQYFKKFYYPPIFVQGSHVSEIENTTNANDKRSKNYGL